MKALTNAKRIIRGLSKGERKDLIEWLQSENISASTRNNHMRIKELEDALRQIDLIARNERGSMVIDRGEFLNIYNSVLNN